MVKLHVNGQEQSFDGDPSMPLLWYLAGRVRAHRNEIRLRRRAVRRLHRPCRRSGHPCLHHRHQRCRWPLGDDDRGARSATAIIRCRRRGAP